jgi:hypothetical protein
MGIVGITTARRLKTSATVDAALPAGTNNIGDVDVLTVPTDPFGANADAASATGSISAKLRFIAATGIPVTGTVTVGAHAVTNAGTFVVQENGAALTALQLIDDVVYAEDIAAQAADKGVSILAVRRDTPTALATTDNDYIQLTTNATGHLWVAGPVTVASGGIASGAIASGAVASGALAAGSIAAGAIADMIVDDAAFTPATSRVIMAGFEADEGSTDSVDEGDAGAARMTLDRKQIVTVLPHTTGGLTTFMASGSDGSSILVATKQTIKASAGQLYGWYLFNPEAAATFVHIYNTDTVTVGTTNPQISLAIPAGSAANVFCPQGIVFDTAMSCSATTTAGGNTAPATGVSAVFLYK